MTTPIDFNGIMPMHWIFAVDPAQVSTSQRLNVKYGQRTVDSTNAVTVEPGVYELIWDTNMPDTEWSSFYFRDYTNASVTFTNTGARSSKGRQRVVIPKKAALACYSALTKQLDAVEPVVGVTLIPVAPLANVFET